MINIVLHEPEIPANTGNIGRTCCAAGVKLHLIEPLGFRLDEKSVKRAGLDYWEHLDYEVYEDYEDFLRLFLERLSQRLEEKVTGPIPVGTDSVAASDVENEDEQNVSDAYIAFRNFGNTNRMAVYLKPTEKM